MKRPPEPWGRACGERGRRRERARAELGRVHKFPHPVHMSYGPATLGEWAGIPVFPSPYYY